MLQKHFLKIFAFAFACSVSLSALPAKAALMYWNLFNIEGENQQNAVYITYASRIDMLTDTA